MTDYPSDKDNQVDKSRESRSLEADTYGSLDDDFYESYAPPPRRRWFARPSFAITMFVLTVFSTMWAGITAWSPDAVIEQALNESSLLIVRRCVLDNWQTGVLFSAALLVILLMHEFGHYLMMRRYGIQSTLPIFIPFPLNPFGTCGALILMDPSRADRKQIFDIGLAGPLAGLVVAVPMAAIGLTWSSPPPFAQMNGIQLGQPLILHILDYVMGTNAMLNSAGISASSSNPFSMSAWIGLLITGINMTPLSQLDGGHVAFGIFGRWSNYVAKSTFVAVLGFMFLTQSFLFLPMLLLILLIGLNYPPSSNDFQPIGVARTIIGFASLSLPILCIPAKPFIF